MFVIKKCRYTFFIFLLSAFLWHFFLCQDRWHGDVPPHLAQPCCLDLVWAVDLGLISRHELRAYICIELTKMCFLVTSENIPMIPRSSITRMRIITVHSWSRGRRIQQDSNPWPSMVRQTRCHLIYHASMCRYPVLGVIEVVGLLTCSTSNLCEYLNIEYSPLFISRFKKKVSDI